MKLVDFFARHPKIALAFSGGVDSSYLLYAAKKAGTDVKAYYAKSDFQPEFEFRDAEMLLGPNNLSVLNEYKKQKANSEVCYSLSRAVFLGPVYRNKT